MAHIHTHKNYLAKNDFCTWMQNQNKAENILAFAPAMSFFVLGFQDILSLLYKEQPKNELEKMLNVHCLEDSQHWKWFLNDLKALNYLSGSTYEYIYKLWNEDNKVPRMSTYYFAYLAQKLKDARFALVFVECLEAAFAVFIQNLKPGLEQTGVFSRLHYFGHRHEEGEASHEMGSWIEEDAHASMEDKLSAIEFTDAERDYAMQICDDVFAKFQEMFIYWNEFAINNKEQKSVDINYAAGNSILNMVPETPSSSLV